MLTLENCEVFRKTLWFEKKLFLETVIFSLIKYFSLPIRKGGQLLYQFIVKMNKILLN